MNNLREKVAEIVNQIQCPTCCELLNWENRVDYGIDVRQAINQILALFPTTLTLEEIKEIVHQNKRGITCGSDGTMFATIVEEDFARDIYKALIGKCATPTFSGGIKTPEEVAEDLISKLPNSYLYKSEQKPQESTPEQQIAMGQANLNKPKEPTEQKEYCTCEPKELCPCQTWEPGKSIPVEKVNPPICANCHKEIRMGKPIPAEKKETEADMTRRLWNEAANEAEKKECGQFLISACCNASVKEHIIYTCEACGQGCKLAKWNKEPVLKNSICDVCKEICKATHPRYVCALFKPVCNCGEPKPKDRIIDPLRLDRELSELRKRLGLF